MNDRRQSAAGGTAAPAARGRLGSAAARLTSLLVVLAAAQGGIALSRLPALSVAWFDARGAPLLWWQTQSVVLTHAGLALATLGLGVMLPRPRPGALDRFLNGFSFATLAALDAAAQCLYDANLANVPSAPFRALAWVGVLYLLGLSALLARLAR